MAKRMVPIEGTSGWPRPGTAAIASYVDASLALWYRSILATFGGFSY